MSFDCGNCLVNADQKVFDLIISSHDNFHLGKYCNFDCLQKDIDTIAEQYKDSIAPKKELAWETMRQDIVNFFDGGSDPIYSYLKPDTFITNESVIYVLNSLFHECEDPSLQKQILCYWISCVEPGGNYPNIKSFEETKRPQVLANGAIIICDDGDSILVCDAEPYNGESYFTAKIKDQVHNIAVSNISFNMFSEQETTLV